MLTYDYRGLTVTFNDGSNDHTYLIDPEGRRGKKVSSGVTTYYIRGLDGYTRRLLSGIHTTGLDFPCTDAVSDIFEACRQVVSKDYSLIEITDLHQTIGGATSMPS